MSGCQIVLQSKVTSVCKFTKVCYINGRPELARVIACCLHCLLEIAHQDCRWTQITEIAATRLNENEKPQEKKESGAY